MVRGVQGGHLLLGAVPALFRNAPNIGWNAFVLCACGVKRPPPPRKQRVPGCTKMLCTCACVRPFPHTRRTGRPRGTGHGDQAAAALSFRQQSTVTANAADRRSRSITQPPVLHPPPPKELGWEVYGPRAQDRNPTPGNAAGRSDAFALSAACWSVPCAMCFVTTGHWPKGRPPPPPTPIRTDTEFSSAYSHCASCTLGSQRAWQCQAMYFFCCDVLCNIFPGLMLTGNGHPSNTFISRCVMATRLCGNAKRVFIMCTADVFLVAGAKFFMCPWAASKHRQAETGIQEQTQFSNP